MTESELLELNAVGIIPGPEESERAFEVRAKHCLELKNWLEKENEIPLPFKIDCEKTGKALKGSDLVTERLFDFRAKWVPVFFSNYQLAPWHGGCAWIFQLQVEGPKAAFLQLRKGFAHRPRYLKIYDRDELIAHELSHIGRMAFEEESFEEMLAYQTSPSTFRRWFGPLVQSSKETFFFVLTLFLIFCLDFYLLMTENSHAYFEAMGLKLIPLGMFILALGRLWIRHRLFNRCLSNLKHKLGSLTKAHHVIYRLTDKEIKSFARDPSAIDQIAFEQPSPSLRWRLLQLAYF